MSNFVVSARKYRPQRFDEVVGQQHVSQTLKNALQSDHLAHAFLFCGPRGVGKTTCARILAKTLNCQNPSDDFEPCNTCNNCTSFSKNASFNITELDAASNNSVEHIRALIEQVRFQPQQGQYKVFIIDEVHMLSQAAFNAFLKTLEEPPSYAIFILATTEKHKIIPTILSRCQIFDFKRIQSPDIVEHLADICEQESVEADPDALHVIAQKADGALRDALSIFDRIVSFSGKKISYEDVITNLNVLDYDYHFRVVEALLAEDMAQVLVIFDDILRKGFDPDLFMTGLAEHIRNLLVCQDAQTLPLLDVGDKLRERYQQQALLCSSAFLLTCLNLANDCDINYKLARNKRLHVEMTLIKMASIGRAYRIADAPPVEKKTTDQSKSTESNPKITVVSNTAPDPPPAAPANMVQEEEPAYEAPPEPVAPSGQTDETKPAAAALPTPPPAETSTPSQNGKHLLASANIGDMMAELKATATAEEKPVEFDLAEVQKIWDRYTEKTVSDSVRIQLKNTLLEVETNTIILKVSSDFAEGTIREESGLMDYLRKELKAPKLIMSIQIDTSLKKEEPVSTKPKILSAKDKYLQMREDNPAVEQLRKAFDLRPDE